MKNLLQHYLITPILKNSKRYFEGYFHQLKVLIAPLRLNLLPAPSKFYGVCLIVLMAAGLSSCANLSTEMSSNRQMVYQLNDNGTDTARFAPVFVIEHSDRAYNRIGTPNITQNDQGQETVFVNTDTPSIYTETRSFQTSRGEYTNLVYRVHFSMVPGSMIPFHIGQGKNVGLLVIITLNSSSQPVLITTVHTCGCYLAFVPTSLMPESCLPENWTSQKQKIHSESLPGLLDLSEMPDDQFKPWIVLRDGTHRVKDMFPAKPGAGFDIQTKPLHEKALSELESIEVAPGTTRSFFETEGSRKGYVKGSQKPWERLFMSWWAFDFRVGEDKKFGRTKEEGIVFYTSLKPWDRERSDMRDFKSFLTYWGWHL